MPRDSSGNVSLSRQRAVTGQTVLAEQVNVPFDDVQNIFNSVAWRDGLSPMTGNLNMNGFKVTGLGDGTASGDAVSYGQFSYGLAFSGVLPGTVQAFRRKTAPSGWVIENGGTIGNASSGATTRANADTEALFTVLWTEFTNAELPIQTSAGAASTRGTTAAADFAANKRMSLFDSRSRFLRGSDSGLGFDATLIPGLAQIDAIKDHVHPFTTNQAGNHEHPFPRAASDGDQSRRGYDFPSDVNRSFNFPIDSAGQHSHTGTTNNNTGGSPLETRGRSSVVLYCIKL